jgi:hypothetical protein
MGVRRRTLDRVAAGGSMILDNSFARRCSAARFCEARWADSSSLAVEAKLACKFVRRCATPDLYVDASPKILETAWSRCIARFVRN